MAGHILMPLHLDFKVYISHVFSLSCTLKIAVTGVRGIPGRTYFHLYCNLILAKLAQNCWHMRAGFANKGWKVQVA